MFVTNLEKYEDVLAICVSCFCKSVPLCGCHVLEICILQSLWNTTPICMKIHLPCAWQPFVHVSGQRNCNTPKHSRCPQNLDRQQPPRSPCVTRRFTKTIPCDRKQWKKTEKSVLVILLYALLKRPIQPPLHQNPTTPPKTNPPTQAPINQLV